MKEKSDKKLKRMKENEGQLANASHHCAKNKKSEKSKNVKKLKQKVVKKKSENLTTNHETEHSTTEPVERTERVLKKSNKRKRSTEDQSRNELKEKTLGDSGADCTSPPAAKKLKGLEIPQLTRKQRRNRKKNSNKNNKYKHLAINKTTEDDGDRTKAGSCSDAGFNKSVGNKTSCVDLGTQLVHQLSNEENGSFRTEIHSLKKKGLSKQSQKMVHTMQTPAASLKSKRKMKAKHQKKQQPEKPVTAFVPEMSDADISELSDFDDDYDSAEEAHDQEKNIAHPKVKPNASDNTGASESKTRDKVSEKETSSSSTSSKKKNKALTALEKAWDKLNAARFRFLNERLYTSTGAEALGMFQDDPQAFQVYHQGFQHQTSQWPVNPLDTIIQQLSKLPKSTVVADFGCGDARLAESLPQNTVHSFDLVATKPCVTACDISEVPLEGGSVGVVVFCLSLMGTNLSDYLCEANRVLCKGGSLKIAEVVSRFHSVGRFVRNVEALGFHLQKKKFLGKMFMMFNFTKVKEASRKRAPSIQLKACYYRRR